MENEQKELKKEEENQFMPRPKTIDKVIRIGSYNDDYYKTLLPVFCHIQYKDMKLSISGVVSPLKSGNCKGSCGQIYDEIIDNLDNFTYAKSWNKAKAFQFVEYWKEFHLNDMQAGCEHQRAEKWEDILIDDTKPRTQDNMAMWTSYKDNKKQGLLSKPCKICGYKYGSKWLKKEVPTNVLIWLNNLPLSDRTPNWK